MYHQGLFKPINPGKYIGNVKNIVYRSGWEAKFMRQLDHDLNVVRWSSEELAIPYLSPKDKKWHRYFPDFIYETKDGKKYMVEIKPSKQSQPPKQSKNKRKMISEAMTYEVNKAKWAYANEFCKKHGIIFKVLTENELFPKLPNKKITLRKK